MLRDINYSYLKIANNQNLSYAVQTRTKIANIFKSYSLRTFKEFKKQANITLDLEQTCVCLELYLSCSAYAIKLFRNFVISKLSTKAYPEIYISLQEVFLILMSPEIN
jgi:hypothetical protein